MSMAYTAEESRTVRLDSEILGHAQPWMVTHRGLEYPGEVIVAETVNAEWGQPLEGDVTFRVVLYTVPRRIPAGQIRDPRIAMAVPRRAADPTRASLSRELRAIHEAKECYITSVDPDVQAVRSSIAERESSLLGELSRREALSYSRGRIYTHPRISLKPAGIFAEGMAPSWVDRLAKAVFDQAYPSVPFDEFPRTLTGEKIEAVFRGIFQEDPEAVGVTSAFGPPLGLTRPDAPTAFDPRGCRVIDLIGRELGSDVGEMPARDLVQLLCVGYGLNRPLAALYTLAWVHRARADVELISDHSIQLRRGGRFPSDRVSWDLVPEIYFTRSITDQLGVLRTRPSPSWNAVLPYSNLLVEGLRVSRDETEIAKLERLLLRALGDLGRRLEDSREATVALAASLGEAPEARLKALDPLEVLSSATGYPEFHALARGAFGGPSGLSESLDLHDRLEQLAQLAPAITRSRIYLTEMTFGRDHQDLAMRRESVIGRIALDGLMDNPSLWKSVQEGFDQLRRECANVYLSHHARYHAEANELLSRLEASRPQVEALDRFNKVPEFGGPLGTDVPGRFKELMTSIRSCTLREDEISLDEAPFCQACALPLAEEPPRRDVPLLLADTDKAMREYNRRLSSEGVRRILAHPTREQLDKFINLAQISDLSVLANVLDEQVVEFLRGFVRPS